MSVLKLRNEFAFICLSFRSELLQCVCFRDSLLAELLFLSAELHHLGFDSREVRVFDGLSFGWHHIVIETILDSRTNTELDTRIELLQRLGHEVRRGMPESMLSLSIVPLMQFDSTIGGEGLIEFHYLKLLCVIVFDRSHKDILRQTSADRFSHLERGNSTLVLTDSSVRELNFNHIDKPTNVYARPTHNCQTRH